MTKIHVNKEYLTGFTEAVLSNLNEHLFEFKKYLAGYEIDAKKVDDTALTRVVIHYRIDGDEKERNVQFEVSETSMIVALRLKIELVSEEIIATVRSWNERS